MKSETMQLLLAALLVAAPVTLAQQAEPPKEAATAKPGAPAAAPAEEEAAVTAADPVVQGVIDVGVRWVKDPLGDFQTYRSIVNLGQGVRLANVDLNIVPTGFRLFDSLRLGGSNWGGDPYNTMRMDLEKRGIYRFVGTYSNIAYFNYLPSFANTQATGAFFNQRAYDTQIRNIDNEFQLFPGTRFTPYLAYTRNTDFGNGITTLVADRNEYPLRNLIRWGQDTYRGGIRADFGRSHLTVEHGATAFRDDQQVFSTERLGGNRNTPLVGQSLFLSDGRQAYAIRGSGRFTKVLFVANPYDWVDLYGQVLYANPRTEPGFFQNTMGNLVDADSGLLFFSRGFDTLFGDARRPHTSGTFAMELRPHTRFRIRETYETDRIKTDSSAMLSTLLLTPTSALGRERGYIDRLEASHTRQTVEALVDIHRRLTVRGGYRYEWGDSVFRGGSLNQINPQERVSLERHVGLAGIQARPWDRLTLVANAEISNGVRTYFRTGLQDYHKVRAQARYRLNNSMNFNAVHVRLDNRNPAPGVDYKFLAQSSSLNLQWLPKGGSRVSLLADYTRSSIRSDIDYLEPQILQPRRSLYVDNAHTGSLLADFTLRSSGVVKPKITVGGSFVTTAGSRPSRYYQPTGRILLPVTEKIHFYSEWRWFGLNQPFYLFEGFRTHMIMTGVRFNM